MPFKQITPINQVDNYLKEQLEQLQKAIINAMSYVGEMCLNEARTGGNYIDRTGNLRNSIGYLIIDEGKVLRMGSFSPSEGGKQGSKFAQSLVKEYPKGIALIVVAGMNYAGYVSAKGYNVLDSSEILAEKLVPQIMKQLGFEKAA